jgi:hypothetical protein
MHPLRRRASQIPFQLQSRRGKDRHFSRKQLRKFPSLTIDLTNPNPVATQSQANLILVPFRVDSRKLVKRTILKSTQSSHSELSILKCISQHQTHQQTHAQRTNTHHAPTKTLAPAPAPTNALHQQTHCTNKRTALTNNKQQTHTPSITVSHCQQLQKQRHPPHCPKLYFALAEKIQQEEKKNFPNFECNTLLILTHGLRPL